MSVSITYRLDGEAWYARNLRRDALPSVSIEIYDEADDQAVSLELVCCDDIGDGRPGLQLRMFDDAFVAFTLAPQLFTVLGLQAPDTPARAAELLAGMGARDDTPRTAPGTPVQATWRRQ